MKSKVFFMGVTVGALIVGCASLVCVKFLKKDVDTDDQTTTSQVAIHLESQKNLSSVTYEEDESKEILEIVSKKKVYLEEYDSENYEVLVKNTSKKSIKKIEFTFGEGIYELYNVEANETFKVTAFSGEENLNLEIINVSYSIPNYFEDEVTFKNEVQGSSIKCTVTNNGDREIYANQVIYFLKDSNGNTVMKTIEYSGCFNPELVVESGKTFSFDFEIPEGFTLMKGKGVIFKYSDLEFKDYTIKQFSEVA